LPSCATATTTHTWIFSLWLRPVGEAVSGANCLNGWRNAQLSRAYSTLISKCARGMKKRKSFIVEWVTAHCFSFPATIKELRQRFAWAEICPAALSTRELTGSNPRSLLKRLYSSLRLPFRVNDDSEHEQSHLRQRSEVALTPRQGLQDDLIMAGKLMNADGFTKTRDLAKKRGQGSHT
jgi:hypothetical protein